MWMTVATVWCDLGQRLWGVSFWGRITMERLAAGVEGCGKGKRWWKLIMECWAAGLQGAMQEGKWHNSHEQWTCITPPGLATCRTATCHIGNPSNPSLVVSPCSPAASCILPLVGPSPGPLDAGHAGPAALGLLPRNPSTARATAASMSVLHADPAGRGSATHTPSILDSRLFCFTSRQCTCRQGQAGVLAAGVECSDAVVRAVWNWFAYGPAMRHALSTSRAHMVPTKPLSYDGCHNDKGEK